MGRSLLPALLCALLVLSACASKRDTAEQPTPLESIGVTLPVERLWSVRFGDTGRSRIALAPVIRDGQVFAAGADGRVVHLDAETGSVVWERRLDVNLTAGPGVGDGMVVVAARNGRIVALNANDGSERWRTTVTSQVYGTPGVTRGIVAVRTGDERMIGMDAATGDELWRVEQPVPSLTLRGSAGVATVGDLMVAGFANGRLLAVQARDGQVVWEMPFAVSSGRTEVERMVDFASTPRMLGRDVFAVSYQGQLAALSSDSGRVLWTRDFSSTAGLGVAADGVWVTDADSEVWGIDRFTGSERWRQAALRARAVTAPAAGQDWIALGDLDGWVHFLDSGTGEFVNRVRAERAPIHAAPVVSGNLLFVQGGGGSLTAYRVGD